MNIDMILTNMKEYLNEYELDELGECGMPCFLPSWSSDSWILGPEHMSESAMQHRYHLHETLQATGEVKTRQILQERLKRNAVYIMYCHDVVSIEILLFSLKMRFSSKKMVIFMKRALYLGYVFPWQSVTPHCVGILGIRYLLRQESSTRER